MVWVVLFDVFMPAALTSYAASPDCYSLWWTPSGPSGLSCIERWPYSEIDVYTALCSRTWPDSERGLAT